MLNKPLIKNKTRPPCAHSSQTVFPLWAQPSRAGPVPRCRRPWEGRSALAEVRVEVYFVCLSAFYLALLKKNKSLKVNKVKIISDAYFHASNVTRSKEQLQSC